MGAHVVIGEPGKAESGHIGCDLAGFRRVAWSGCAACEVGPGSPALREEYKGTRRRAGWVGVGGLPCGRWRRVRRPWGGPKAWGGHTPRSC